MNDRDRPSLLAIFAHPDDETFRPGGTLALLARQGVRVHVLTATRGGAGSVGEPPLCTLEDLPYVRETELRCACKMLGLESPRLLNYRDGHLAEVDSEQVIGKICDEVLRVQARIMLTFGPDGLSGHPDHIAIGQFAAAAYEQVFDAAALYTLAVPCSLAEQFGMLNVRPVPDEQIALSLDVSPVWQSKKAAMACHKTQWAAIPLLHTPEERQRLFFGQEHFVLASCRHPESVFLPKYLKEYRL